MTLILTRLLKVLPRVAHQVYGDGGRHPVRSLLAFGSLLADVSLFRLLLVFQNLHIRIHWALKLLARGRGAELK